MILRRDVLAFATMAVVSASTTDACTLTGTRQLRAADTHFDARARRNLQRYVVLINKNGEVSQGEIEEFSQTNVAEPSPQIEELIKQHTLSDGKRDNRPATLINISQIALSRYKAIYLFRLSRSAFLKAQDGGSCGPYEDAFWQRDEAWLAKFEQNVLRSLRHIDELDSDYKELIA